MLLQISSSSSSSGRRLAQETATPLVIGTTVTQWIISAEANANRADTSAEWFRRVVIDDGRRRNEGGKLRLALALHQLLFVAGEEKGKMERFTDMLLSMRVGWENRFSRFSRT